MNRDRNISPLDFLTVLLYYHNTPIPNGNFLQFTTPLINLCHVSFADRIRDGNEDDDMEIYVNLLAFLSLNLLELRNNF